MDWQSLTDKLKKLGVQVGSEGLAHSGTRKRVPIERIVSGRELQTRFGAVYSSDHTYQPDYIHGNHSLRPASPILGISQWAKVPQLSAEALENFIFLDTETTGLSGGTGTMAFMVGVGRFRGADFVLEQFFLRGPAEEAALLAALSEFCDQMAAVVTYNGKSFDIPILNTRYILQGFTSPFESLPHFDLLHLARRIWRARLEQCRLGNIEEEVLGLSRDLSEVPGYLVPEYYSQYLRDGDAEPLRGIFTHNEIDVLSLAALFSHLAEVLEDPTNWNNANFQDLTAVGRLLEQMGSPSLATQMYQKGAAMDKQGKPGFEPLLLEAQLHKRAGRPECAVPLWQQAAAANSLHALEELAKYCEHSLRDPFSALPYCQQALQYLNENPNIEKHTTWKTAFLHRLQRLERKCASGTTQFRDEETE